MSRGGADDDDEGARLQAVTARAIRRLDILEYTIVAAAALLALVAGGIVAYLLTAVTTWSFRLTWAAASLLFFVVPAAMAWWSNRETGVSGAEDAPDGR